MWIRAAAALLAMSAAASAVASGAGAAPFVVAPRYAHVTAGGTRRFEVPGRAPVAWSLLEGEEAGTVSSDGTYVAGRTPGTYHLVGSAGGRRDVAVVVVSLPRTAPAAMPLISGNVPAYASGGSAAALAVDDDYATAWRSPAHPTPDAPAWIALDLSRVPAERRGRVVVAWYGDAANFDYDLRLARASGSDLPARYTVDGHPGPGGGPPPPERDPRWTTLVTVSAPNELHSRQHVVDLAGDQRPLVWLRLRVTEARGEAGQDGVALNLDVHDARLGVDDDWIFFGGSATAAAMRHAPAGNACPEPCPYGAPGTFGQRVAAALPGRFPLHEAGGQAGLSLERAVGNLPRWLASFPGRYVALAYGPTDAWSIGVCDVACADAFEARTLAAVRAVLAVRKLPVVPTISWSPLPEIQRSAPILNQRIRRIWATRPEVVPGPDHWALGAVDPRLVGSDGVQPSALGAYALRSAWVEAMLASVYAQAR